MRLVELKLKYKREDFTEEELAEGARLLKEEEKKQFCMKFTA